MMRKCKETCENDNKNIYKDKKKKKETKRNTACNIYFIFFLPFILFDVHTSSHYTLSLTPLSDLQRREDVRE